MAVTADILRTWRNPAGVMRDLLRPGPREDRAIAYVMAACLLIFVAQWPRLTRMSAGFDLLPGAEVPDFSRLIAYEFASWLMVWPLILYFLAAISHILALVVGGKGSWYSARLALFWALLATSPVLLLHGLMAGFSGPGAGTNLIGAIWLIGFFTIWGACLWTAERQRHDV